MGGGNQSKCANTGSMNKQEWENRIKQASRDAGTYQSHFDDIIETLASIMENRDKAQEQFIKQFGGKPVVAHTNKGGNTNLVKNPALVMVNDLNATALSYWRDLGLTPKGFQTLQTNGFKKQDTSLEDVLANIGI